MTAASAYDLLARPVQRWIRDQGWAGLRPIQAEAVHAILGGDRDQIIAASTAGGKTEAAFLPLLSQVIDAPAPGGGFDLVYIGPLKALITDQAQRLTDICATSDLPVVPWHGDIAASVKTRALQRPRGVLLITPESLEALFIRRGPQMTRLFGALRAVVIDELHSMLDSERGVQMRSLLNRLELALGRRVRRIGLSATLGDIGLACACLRPDGAADVGRIQALGGGSELRVQLRGYATGAQPADIEATTDAIAGHLFRHLRGSNNLVFAGSRTRVEIYADRLRQLCETAALPLEFYAHHASLARDHRDFVEQRLKAGTLPTTAVCTSTLELGIDIGDVTCVAQIGAPFSVASLRQRLGRSGRRAGRPAILRQYAIEARLDARTNVADQLRLGLVRAIAMIDLLIEGWCEPPEPAALHLSTLVHQILSVIAERGGARANRLHQDLCRTGPFRQVDAGLFLDLLRALGRTDTGLIEQSADGLLLLGATGERLVEHYSFYAVFQTPEEYRLICRGEDLGTLPVDNPLRPGALLIFSGRRWEVRAVDTRDKVILVEPSSAGVPPVFESNPGRLHDRVIVKMREILRGDAVPVYLDVTAASLLAEARRSHALLPFDHGVARLSDSTTLLATMCGTTGCVTLALALQARGYVVQEHDGFLEVHRSADLPDVTTALAELADGAEADLFGSDPNLVFEKFHPYLTDALLRRDALSSRLAPARLAGICRGILGYGPAA